MVEEAKRALLAGQAVVIGLQATGEAAADAMALAPGEPCGWVSVTREMLLRFVDLHFPTQYEANPKGAAKNTELGQMLACHPFPFPPLKCVCKISAHTLDIEESVSGETLSGEKWKRLNSSEPWTDYRAV